LNSLCTDAVMIVPPSVEPPVTGAIVVRLYGCV
jgi:hypothetical protein